MDAWRCKPPASPGTPWGVWRSWGSPRHFSAAPPDILIQPDMAFDAIIPLIFLSRSDFVVKVLLQENVCSSTSCCWPKRSSAHNPGTGEDETSCGQPWCDWWCFPCHWRCKTVHEHEHVRLQRFKTRFKFTLKQIKVTLSVKLTILMMYFMYFIVELRSRSRSRSGPGQVQVRKVRNWPEPYHIFGFHPPTTHHPPPTQTFFSALEGSRHVRWT